MAGKYTEFPEDKNNNPIYAATRKKLVVLDGDANWKDLSVPSEFDCKAVLITIHGGDSASYSNFLPAGEFHYIPDSTYNTTWIPLQSGMYPFAGTAGELLGRVRAATSTKISVLFLT